MHEHLKFDPSQLCISVAKVSVTRHTHALSHPAQLACGMHTLVIMTYMLFR